MRIMKHWDKSPREHGEIAVLWGFQDPADKVLSNMAWVQHWPYFEQEFAPDYLLWSHPTQMTDSAVSVETIGPKESR